MRRITFGSLFAGIGGFDAGFEAAGLHCLWQVEIDKDASRVLDHHWPITGRMLWRRSDVRECGKANLQPVDVICGGFPCQDLSVAGKRKGITGARSGLFYEMTRIVDELRPSLLVFENVPGLLSSGHGRDFLTVLVELDRIGYCGAWTTLDAQFFGVAQRRRRIFGVFARNDLGAKLATEILALPHRSGWNPEKGEEAGANTAACLRSRSHSPGVSGPGRGGEDDSNLVVAAQRGNNSADHAGDETKLVYQEIGHEQWRETLPSCEEHDGKEAQTLVTHSLSSEGADASEDGTGRGVPLAVQPIEPERCDTCNGEGGGFVESGNWLTCGVCGGSGNAPAVAIPIDMQHMSDSAHPNGVGTPGVGIGENGDPAPTLGVGRATAAVAFNIIGLGQQGKNHTYEADKTGAIQHKGNSASGNEAGTVIAFSQNQREELRELGEQAGALPSEPGTHQQTFVAQEEEPQSFQTRIARNGRGQPKGIVDALTSNEGGAHADSKPHVFGGGMMVRRLMPVECCRLQGFPDDWLEIEPPLSDSAKYRLLGNAVAVPVALWLGKRIAATLGITT